MVDPAPSPACSGRPEPVQAPVLFGVLVTILVCACRTVLDDGDTYTHIAAGLWMQAHRTILTWDPFSATFAGQAWAAHEWLAEVSFGAAYRAAGLTGVVLLSAAAAGLTSANLARHVGQRCGWAATMSLTSAALLCALPGLSARPHLLALPVMEVWAAGLLAVRAEGHGPSLGRLAGLCGLMTVWANLHGGFAIGLALAAAFAADAGLRRAAWRDGTMLRWGLLLGGATVAAAMTPRGWAGLWFPVRLLELHSLASIKEWQPLLPSGNIGFEAVLLGLIGLLGCGRVKIGWFALTLLVGLLHLAFAHERHAMLFGVIGALLLADPVGRAFRERARERAQGRAGFGWGWGGTAIAGTILLRAMAPVAMVDGPATPVSAVAEVPDTVRRSPVLNSTQFGGYLALAGLHPFIDGRAELFGDAFVADYLAMSEATVLTERVEQYGFGWAVLAVDDPLVTAFDGMVGWRRVRGDATAVVFVRG